MTFNSGDFFCYWYFDILFEKSRLRHAFLSSWAISACLSVEFVTHHCVGSPSPKKFKSKRKRQRYWHLDKTPASSSSSQASSPEHWTDSLPEVRKTGVDPDLVQMVVEMLVSKPKHVLADYNISIAVTIATIMHYKANVKCKMWWVNIMSITTLNISWCLFSVM